MAAPSGSSNARGGKSSLDTFGANLLSHLARRKAEARKEKQREADAVARHRAQVEARRQEEAKQHRRVAALNVLSRAGSSWGTRRKSTATPARRTGLAQKGKRRSRTREEEDNTYYDDEDVNKPLKGMEFVVRKQKVKEPQLRNTSDYSDLFGDDYLVGAEVPATKALAKTSKADTERFRQAKERIRAQKNRSKEEIEKFARDELALKKAGLHKTKKGREKLERIRNQHTSKHYESVDEPTSWLSTSQSSHTPSTGGAASAAKSPAKTKISAATKKKLADEHLKRANAARKAELAARLRISTGSDLPPRPPRAGGGSVKRSASGPPRASPPAKRARNVDSDDSDFDDSDDGRERRDTRKRHDVNEDAVRRRRKPVKKKSREVYSSEEDDSDSDDGDGGGGGGGGGLFESTFDELEEEEEYSRACGRREDLMEKKREKIHKQRKMQQKKALGLD